LFYSGWRIVFRLIDAVLDGTKYAVQRSNELVL
jgi:hypothetical protein